MKRNNRKRGIKKPIKQRIALLTALFLASFVLSVVLLNFDRQDVLGGQSYKSQAPVVSIYSLGEKYGRCVGYTDELDFGRIRNPLVPIDSSRKLTIEIDGFGEKISNANVLLFSKSGDKNISTEELKDFSISGTKISSDITLSAIVNPDTEYILGVNLTCKGQEYNYYSRIIRPLGCHETECADFAKYFCETALTENYTELATYMEPKGSVLQDAAFVSINSTLADVGWKNFPADMIVKPEVSFSEITPTYVSLNLRYRVAGKNVEYSQYTVDEYYRMRYGTERIYLLDFERKLTKDINSTNVAIENNELLLGENSYNIDFSTNQTGSVVAFVWDGNLYGFDVSKSVLSRVFHFEGNVQEGEMQVKQDHGIRIINIDEIGNIDFVVYGYMSAGLHEGKSGIGLYHYENELGVTDEQRFISTNIAPEALMASFDGRAYLSPDGNLYLAVESDLIKLSSDSDNAEVLMTNGLNGSFKLSDSGRYLAVLKHDLGEIEVRDLYSGKTLAIPAPENKFISFVNFLGEDLAYGVVDNRFNTQEFKDSGRYPMDRIVIADIESGTGDILKDYHSEGYYITRAVRDSSYILLLEISSFDGQTFRYAGSDSIQNVAGLRDTTSFLESSIKEGSTYLTVKNRADGMKTAMTVKGFDQDNISYSETSPAFYSCSSDCTGIYGYKGKYAIGYDIHLNNVVDLAYNKKGYCLDVAGKKLWQYGRGNYKWNNNILDKLLDNEEKRSLNLYGNSLQQILPYVYMECPVYVDEKGENPLLITGYGNNYISIYEVKTGEKRELLIDEATTLFGDKNNAFTSYIIK